MDEFSELSERIQKLEAFISANPKFKELEAVDQKLMFWQLHAMRSYHSALRERIARQKIDKEEEKPTK